MDSRFGSRDDLVELVQQAHQRGLRVLLDVIFNHSGANWLYRPALQGAGIKAAYTSGQYPLENGAATRCDRDNSRRRGRRVAERIRDPDHYTRAGTGSLDASRFPDVDQAEFRRTDFEDLRDFALDAPGTLNFLARAYMYWIALTDCDGFRIDTVKHVSYEQARNFCGAIKEFAINLGKRDFFLVGEVPDDDFASRYLNAVGRNLNATLDISGGRLALRDLSRGVSDPSRYFSGFDVGSAPLGSHRNLGDKLMSVLDDHDHVYGEKLRFAARAVNDHQTTAATAIQLLTLASHASTTELSKGLPVRKRRKDHGCRAGAAMIVTFARQCLDHAFHGPMAAREFRALVAEVDLIMSCQDSGHSARPVPIASTRPIRSTSAPRRSRPLAPISRCCALAGSTCDPSQFSASCSGPRGLVSCRWSRILTDEEALCVVNPNGLAARGADVLVDAQLNLPGSAMTVIMNSAQTGGVTRPLIQWAARCRYVVAHPAPRTSKSGTSVRARH